MVLAGSTLAWLGPLCNHRIAGMNRLGTRPISPSTRRPASYPSPVADEEQSTAAARTHGHARNDGGKEKARTAPRPGRGTDQDWDAMGRAIGVTMP